MNGKQISVVVIGITSIFLVLYDLFALYFFGAEGTISVVINEWAFESNPLLVFMLGVVFGGLIVHFFKWKPVNESL
jgi:succinate dehydrogenase hydrophobic anchor subunit